jgi:hypothetical protein
MNDDWRLRISTPGGEDASSLAERLDAHEIESDLQQTFHDRVVVSVDEGEVFCYGGDRAQLDSARAEIEKLAGQHGWQLEFELRHWHPTAEQWEDPDEPLPTTDAEQAREHQKLIASEREESTERGYPEFEVRIKCSSRRQAGQLADQLRAEGIPVVHRWTYVLVGALDEDSGNALAERLRSEAPAGSEISLEGNRRAAYDEGPFRPFAWLGGLGG